MRIDNIFFRISIIFVANVPRTQNLSNEISPRNCNTTQFFMTRLFQYVYQRLLYPLRS